MAVSLALRTKPFGLDRPFAAVQRPILRSQVRSVSFPILDAQDWPVDDCRV